TPLYFVFRCLARSFQFSGFPFSLLERVVNLKGMKHASGWAHGVLTWALLVPGLLCPGCKGPSAPAGHADKRAAGEAEQLTASPTAVAPGPQAARMPEEEEKQTAPPLAAPATVPAGSPTAKRAPLGPNVYL